MSAPAMPPILMVEDMDFDYEMTVRGFRQMGVYAPFIRHENLAAAASFLEEAREARQHLPGVVILDLHFQDGDGREFLAQLKSDECTKAIPVVVWSASSDPRIIESCYRQGASSYICKSIDRRDSERAVKQFAEYWTRTVTLPPRV